MSRSLSVVSVVFLIIFELGGIQVIENECGTTNFTLPFIAKGSQTIRGEWPFLTALYLVKKPKYHCGGTLISSKHVLTGTVEFTFRIGFHTNSTKILAAHCIQNKFSSISLHPNDLIVILGAYDLTSRNERGTLTRNVSKINSHPEWDEDYEKYDADLAILLLSEYVTFTDYIRPVCMPADDAVIEGATGSVVGWGLTENGTEPNIQYMKHAFTTVLNDAYCYTVDPGAAVISSERTFCGRGDDGSPSRGDSGGGLYILNGSAWIQHGIISALRTDAVGYVGPGSIVVYTNIKRFKSWIVETVTQSGGALFDSKMNVEMKIKLNCDYQYTVTDRK